MKGPLSLDRCWGRAGRLLTVPSASGFSPSTWASEALGPGSRAAEVGSARGSRGLAGETARLSAAAVTCVVENRRSLSVLFPPCQFLGLVLFVFLPTRGKIKTIFQLFRL